MAIIDLKDWQVEHLRLSVFLIDMIDPINTRFWEALIGNLPAELRSHPQQQLTTEEGPYLDGRLRVEIRNKRIDWRIHPDLTNRALELPTLASYADLVDSFKDLMHNWLSNYCPDIYRVAYGGVMLLPTESRILAYEKLNELLSAVEIDTQNSHDLMYKINRRRNSLGNIEELGINRLSTWSVIEITNAFIEISADSPRFETLHPHKTKSVCRLELDINTAPEDVQILDKTHVPEIFKELVNVGNEIAAEGDIR